MVYKTLKHQRKEKQNLLALKPPSGFSAQGLRSEVWDLQSEV